MRGINSPSSENEVAQKRRNSLPCRVIKGLSVCNSLDIEPFGEPKVNNRPLRYDSYFNNILKLY